MADIQKWTTQKSVELYGINNWGGDYFGANDLGHITISPDGLGGPTVDLFDLVQAVKERDIELPVLFRFNGILRHRVRRIHQAFQDAIKQYEYQGSFFPAFPIKVNQQRHVVDVLRTAGAEFKMGLEVGSKPELIAVLAIHDTPDALLLCNGYKDADYIELALMSSKIGRRPVIIIEKYSELPLVLSVAQKLGVEPEIGFRIRPAGKGSGRWEKSGGDRAKFGLTIGEILQCLSELERWQKLDCVKLLHFHIGSQITAIHALKGGIREAAQVYVQLRARCPKLEYMDVGGGLGVDYDGSKTTFSSSMNYTVDEYARDVVWVIQEICDRHEVPHPHIITESGRATAAYHAVLVFDVLGIANTFSGTCNPKEAISQTENESIQQLANLLIDLSPKNCQETLHDALSLRNDVLEQFNQGLLTIEERALADSLHWAVLIAISKASRELHYLPEDLEKLPAMLTDQYFCNLSVFQSLPDNWAIQQIFPITPLHRLNEEPTVNLVIADITCDSDGKVDSFPDLRDVKKYLQAHELRSGEQYYFASFLVGAYQEILGDLHNLFGDTNAVHVEVTPDSKFDLVNVVYGDSIREVLQYVQYDKEDLCERWRTSVEKAVSEGRLPAVESGQIIKKYAGSFDSYTYLASTAPE